MHINIGVINSVFASCKCACCHLFWMHKDYRKNYKLLIWKIICKIGNLTRVTECAIGRGTQLRRALKYHSNLNGAIKPLNPWS